MGSADRNDDYLSEDPRRPLRFESQMPDGNIQAHETTPILDQNLPCRVRPRGTFSWPGIVIGLLIGTIYCITNIYFGLKTGQICGAPIATTFFTILISKKLQLGLSQAEIMFAVTVSTAVAIMSLAGGFVGPIPGLTQLLGPEEHADGPMKFSWLQLAIFAAALSGFGPVFAMLMREHFLVLSKRCGLPFPTATATAKIIFAYRDGSGHPNQNEHRVVDSRLAPDDQIRDSHPLANAHNDQSTPDSITETRNRCAIGGILVSSIYAALVCLIPSGPGAPCLIRKAAKYSNWVDFSPGVVGQGFIIGGKVVCEMFSGAIFGWIVLPWFLDIKIRATGDADQRRDVFRIWALWLGLVAMLADCSFKIFWTLREVLGEWWQDNDRLAGERNEALIDPSFRAEATRTVGADSTGVRNVDNQGAVQCKKISPRLSKLVLVCALVALAPLCVFAVKQSVGGFVPWIGTLATIFLALPLSYISILATGKTDYTPANPLGRLSQIIVARLDSSSIQYAMIVNIAMGAIVESAACQAGAMMSKLKAGETVGADPDTLFWAQVSGSLIGALVGSLFFRYLMSAKTTEPVPKTKFKMPGAHMFLVAAELALNDGLPKHAMEGAAVIGISFWITAALKIWFADKTWVIWIPSGTAFATGMYNFPSVSINWLIGGLIGHYWGQRGDNIAITLFGSGLMVGEGLSQLISGWLLSVG